MKYLLALFSLILFHSPLWAVGTLNFNTPVNVLGNSVRGVNQMTVPTDSEGKQEQQWNQEEEDNLTDEEKYDLEKLQEQKESARRNQQNDIKDYRYDVPVKKDLH